VGVEDPVGREVIVEEVGLAGLVGPVPMVDTVEEEDQVVKVETVPMAGIVEVEGQVGMEDIGGIMVGMADIMVAMAGSFPDYLSAVS
jgi:hypothetical protein